MLAREELMWFVKNNEKFTWNTEHQYSNQRSAWGQRAFNDKEKASEFERLTNVWIDVPENSFNFNNPKTDFGHYTPKPIELMERIILAHTKENDLILDPFLGSGTTALACKNTGRNFIGIEIDKKYCDMSVKRLFDEQIKLF